MQTVCGLARSLSVARSMRRFASFYAPSSVQIFESMSNNPFFNLALEDYLYQTSPSNVHTLFLWRNNPCIVIGCHQNPWVECNTDQMNKEKVELIRRASGGGAVYQDLGNTNFTFISPKTEFSKELNTAIVINTLATFGIEAEASGRNDIVVNGAKVSGSAYRHGKEKSMHHGTLLVSVDTTALGRLLTPNKKKMESKGVTSVAARVCNLQTLNENIHHDNICTTLAQEFLDTHALEGEVEPLREETYQSDEIFMQKMNEIQNWEWRFGKTPNFSHVVENRWPWGLVTVHFDVRGGEIAEIKVFSDTLYPGFVGFISGLLKGVRHEKESVLKCLQDGAGALEDDIPFKPFVPEFALWFANTLHQ